MKKGFLILLSIVLFSISWGQNLPDCVKEKCDEILKKELGKRKFRKYIKYEGYKCTIKPEKDTTEYCGLNSRHQYLVEYSFTFHKANDAKLKLGFVCAGYNGKMHIQSEYFLRKEQTDLPRNFRRKRLRIMDYEFAKLLACATDSLLNANKNTLQGNLVTTQQGIYWIFDRSGSISNPYGDAELSRRHTVWINPYKRKVHFHEIKVE